MLLLDTPLIDYVRFTTKLEAVGEAWRDHFIQMVREAGAIPRDERFLQYVGKRYDDPLGGSVFVGHWDNHGTTYSLIHAGGAISDELSHWLSSGYARWGAKCTRLDIQATAAQPREWSQWDLLVRLRERGRNVSWKASTDVETGLELATVYVGSRESDRILRIYEKLTDAGHKLLRFETEYKASRADNMMGAICRNSGRVSDYLLYELQTQRDSGLERVFGTAFVGASPNSGRFRRVRTTLEKQAGWLTNGVLPAFARYVNDSNADSRIADMFLRVIENSPNNR